MSIDKKIEFHDGKDKFEEGKTRNSIILVKADWNDYGFQMMFDVFYFDEKGNHFDLGGTRILTSNIPTSKDLTATVIKKKVLEKVSKLNYCTVGEDIQFYRNIYEKLSKEEAMEVLRKINDITVWGIQKLESVKQSIKDNYEQMQLSEVLSTNYMKNDNIDDFVARTLFRLSKDLKNILYLKDIILERKNEKNIIEFISSLNNSQPLAKELSNHVFDYFKVFYSLIDCHEISKEFWKRLVTSMTDYSENPERQKKFLDKVKRLFYDDLQFFNFINKKEGNDAYEIIDKIKGQLKVVPGNHDSNKPIMLCQYTGIDTIKHVIVPRSSLKSANDNDDFKTSSQKKGCLRLTNSRQLNDPSEGNVLLDLLGLSDRGEGNYVGSNIYISSASASIDDLSLWREYTDNGRGVCLVYDNEYINNIFVNSNVDLYRVCYIDIENSSLRNGKIVFSEENEDLEKSILDLYSYLENHKDEKKDIINQLQLIRYLFKNISYKYEQEYRLVVSESLVNKIITDDNNKYGFPFLYTYIDSDVPKYSKVYLGPNSMDWDYVAPYIKYCYSSNDKPISIYKSKLAYRK